MSTIVYPWRDISRLKRAQLETAYLAVVEMRDRAIAHAERLEQHMHRWLCHPDFEYANTVTDELTTEPSTPPGDGWEANADCGDAGHYARAPLVGTHWRRRRVISTTGASGMPGSS